MLDARPVRGRWRQLRSAANVVLIAIFLGVPWIEIAGEPLLRLDVPARQFHVGGLVIFPQELFFLWLIVIGLALALFFFTALAGRLWCGWACPQTVFTDVFAGIARRVQGRRRELGGWRRALVHGLWALACVVIGFHAVAFFVDPRELASRVLRAEFPGAAQGFVIAASLLAWVDLVWLRQNFCKYLCPYARFQGVLFDSDTLVVGYDTARGEPRGKRGRVDGDCVDCGLCVAVCPTQIDIRDGLQLECIACTQCIDACNGVMAKLDRAPDLIGYRSLRSLEGEGRARLTRPRVLVYGTALAAVAISFVVAVGRRLPLDLQIEHNRASLYQTLPDGRIGNGYTLHMQNRAREPQSLRLVLRGDPGFELVAGQTRWTLAPTSSRETRVFVAAPRDHRPAEAPELRLALVREDGVQRELERELTFLFPGTAAR